MKYNNLDGTLNGSFKIGKNGISIKNTNTGLNIVDDNNTLQPLNYKDKVAYEIEKQTGGNKYQINNQNGNLAKIDSTGNNVTFYCYENSESPTTIEFSGFAKSYYKIGDISDQVSFKNGSWGMERKFAWHTITDSDAIWQGESPDGNGQNIMYFAFTLEKAKGFTECLCTHYENRLGVDNEPHMYLVDGTNGTYATCVIYDNRFQNVNEFKNWINENRVEILFQTTTPSFEPVDNCNYGKVNPVDIIMTIRKPNPSKPISPSNIASITGGTAREALVYTGEVRVLNDASNNIVEITSNNYIIEAQDNTNIFEVTVLKTTPMPVSLNSKMLNNIDGENYQLYRYYKESGRTSYRTNKPINNSSTRFSFNGKTEIIKPFPDIDTSPDNVAIIKGINNPFVMSYSTNSYSSYNDRTHSSFPEIEPLIRIWDTDTTDRVAYQNNQWGIVRHVAKFILDGSKNYIISTQSDNFDLAHFYTNDLKSEIDLFPYGDCMSDRFDTRSYGLETFSIDGNPVPEIYILKSRLSGWSESLSDVEKGELFKNWVTQNPITCYARLKNPIFEPIERWNTNPNLKYIKQPYIYANMEIPNPSSPISPDNVANIRTDPVGIIGHRTAPLMKLGKISDRVIYKSNHWNIERNIFEITLDGTETEITYYMHGNWNRTNCIGFWISTGNRMNKSLALFADGVLCTHFQAKDGSAWDSDEQSICASGSEPDGFNIVIPKTVIGWSEGMTVDQTKQAILTYISNQYIQGYPIKIWGIMEQPILEPYSLLDYSVKVIQDPIRVFTTKPSYNQSNSQPISPTNIKDIRGTELTGDEYSSGKISQVEEILFDGDEFDGMNAIIRMNLIKIYGSTFNWRTSQFSTSSEIVDFVTDMPSDFYYGELYNQVCNRFNVWSANDTETIQVQHNNRYIYLFIKKSRLVDWSDSLTEAEKVTKLKNWLDENPIELLYQRRTPRIVRYDMDFPTMKEDGKPITIQGASDWVTEITDLNEIIKESTIEVLPDPIIYGDKIYQCQHTKNYASPHEITGSPYATYIVFTATKNYETGDTFTFNGSPISKVTYFDGQDLLPTAFIKGDIVQGKIVGDTIVLMLQKPTPIKNILINGDFQVNQRRQNSYTGTYIYTVDRYTISNGVLNVVDGGIELDPQGAYSLDFFETFYNVDVWKNKIFTFAAEVDGKTYTYTSTFDGGTRVFSWGELWFASFPNNPDDKRTLAILKPYRKVKVSHMKLEEGPRFTGWYESTFNETLAECQRYYRHYSGGRMRFFNYKSSSNYAYNMINIVFDKPMYKVPTGTVTYRINDGAETTTQLYTDMCGTQKITIGVNVPANSYIDVVSYDVSADL